MAKQTFQHRAISPATRSDVWESLQHPDTWEAIPGVDRVFDPVVDGSGLHAFSFESVAGGRKYLGKATANGRSEAETMAWDIATSELKGSLEVALSTEGDGTVVAVTLTMESLGMLSSMFFPVIASTLGTGFPKAIDEFAASLV